MKLLIISSRFPYPIEKGDKLRLYYQIQELAKHFEIILVTLSDQEVSANDIAQLSPFCKSIHVFRLHHWSILKNCIHGFYKGLPVQIAYFFDPTIKARIDLLIDQEKPDHIYCQLIRVAEYVKELNASKTLDYMDCFSLNSLKRSLKSDFWGRWFWRLEATRLKQYEQSIYPFFDHHTIIASVDARAINLKRGQELTVISNGISSKFFEKSEQIRDIDILFLGNLSYYSNINAVKFLLQQILPILKSKSSSFNLVIAGAHPSRTIERLIRSQSSSVTFYPNVPDTRVLYQRAKVFVAPIHLGTGQQNKVLEALASGCSVVCSDEVSAGFPQLISYLSIARTPEDYASRIIVQCNQFEQNIQHRKEAQELVRLNFNWETNTRALIHLVKK